MPIGDWPYWQQVPTTVVYGGACHHISGVTCPNCTLAGNFSPSSPFYFAGWRCAGCGRCWSPAVTQCLPCGPKAGATGANDDMTDCVPVSEGGLCDHAEDDRSCRGGRHCSC